MVVGGTGYVGKNLVKELIKNKYEVTILVKDPPSYKIPNINYIFLDILDKDSLIKNIKDFDLVINLFSIIRSTNKTKYKYNVLGIKNLLEALKKNNLKNLIHFSTQNVNLKNKGYYAKSKQDAENLILNSGLNYVIIRPNYIYGIDKENFFYKMAFLIKYFRISLIMGNGNYKIQPLLKQEVSKTTINLIKNFKSNQIVEIYGKEIKSMNQIIKLLEQNLNINSLKIHIPYKILNIFKKFISFDVKGIEEDKISKKLFNNSSFSSLEDNLKEISKLF